MERPRPTLGYPGPVPGSTLPANPISPASAAPTRAPAPSDAPTLYGGDPPGGATSLATTPRPTLHRTTVLPEVRSAPEGLTLVPRNQTRYEGEKVLGRGGMGEVALAQDHDIGRKVALKRLLDGQSPHAVARFIDEVRIVGRLEHPNIVPIHDVGIDEHGSLFFVMKYVEGDTLRDIIERLRKGDPQAHATFSFERRLDLFASLLHALQYAHARGLVHRDIKPENVMVGPYGEVVLMDWGIAHLMRRAEGEDEPVDPPTTVLPDAERASNQTVDGQVVGTPEYMSPEQAAGEAATLDGRSDLYSAFVVLFELLTLAPYVEPKETAVATLLAVQDRTPPGPTASVYDHPHQRPVPIELRHFLRHGLAHDRDHRPPSAQAVLGDLERLRAGEFAVECPTTFMKRGNAELGRMMDRFPTIWVVVSLLMLTLVIGGAVGWVVLIRSFVGA